MAFVTLTREQFEAILPGDFQTVEDPRANEIIYQFKTENPKVDVRIYSTVDKATGQTRDVGKDAIRVVFWNNLEDRPLGKGKKILRVEAATTIQERILKRIIEFLGTAGAQNVTDWDYARAILEHEAVSWMDFAQSLLDSLETYGKLTDGQKAYVLGEKNPKGKMTFEARVKAKDPDFFVEESDEKEPREVVEPEGTCKVVEETAEPTGETNLQTDGGIPRVHPEIQPQSIPSPEVKEGGLIPTISYPDWKYPFEFFNPVQSEVYPHRIKDRNMIIGANTSAGKTCACELIMDWILEHGA